jgi:hypothetical protein
MSAAGAAGAPVHNVRRLQEVVDELRARLGISTPVTAAIVATNLLIVTVEPQSDSKGEFLLSFEDGFLDGLDDEELRAVVAHELGHVWIFTHHPYLQTERLANEVAMRIVSRESLQKVYGKVWERGGVKGNLVQFLGGS